MVILQRCTSTGSSIDEDFDCVLDDDNVLFRHRCVNAVFYFKSEEDSKSWGVYNDKDDVTRCKHCDRRWGIFVSQEKMS
jgi:hypothetical protein